MNLRRSLGAVGIGLLLALVASPVYAQAYTMTLQTNSITYSGNIPIVISGAITPAPGPNTGVVITIRNPANAIADVNEVPVQTNGSYSWTSIPGGSSTWTSGTYSVNATWGSSEATLSKVVTFSYTVAATTSSSTTSTSTSTTSTTSTTTSSTSTTSTVAEFPSSALAVVALIAVALAALASRRFEVGGTRGPPVAR